MRLTGAGEQLLARVEGQMRKRIRDLSQRTPDGDRLLESLAWLGQAIDFDMSCLHVLVRAWRAAEVAGGT